MTNSIFLQCHFNSFKLTSTIVSDKFMILFYVICYSKSNELKSKSCLEQIAPTSYVYRDNEKVKQTVILRLKKTRLSKT